MYGSEEPNAKIFLQVGGDMSSAKLFSAHLVASGSATGLPDTSSSLEATAQVARDAQFAADLESALNNSLQGIAASQESICVDPTSGSNLPILQLYNTTEALWFPDIQPTESKHLKITQRSAALTWKLPGLAFTKSAVLSVVSGLVTQQEADNIMSKIPHAISIKPDSVDS